MLDFEFMRSHHFHSVLSLYHSLVFYFTFPLPNNLSLPYQCLRPHLKMDTVPNKVEHLFLAQQFHDRKQRQERMSAPKEQRAQLPVVDYMRPIVADADTGHGGITATMKLVKMFVERGAAGVHVEDQVRGLRFGDTVSFFVCLSLSLSVSRYSFNFIYLHHSS